MLHALAHRLGPIHEHDANSLAVMPKCLQYRREAARGKSLSRDCRNSAIFIKVFEEIESWLKEPLIISHNPLYGFFLRKVR